MKGKVRVDDDPVGCYTLAGPRARINVATMTPAQFAEVTAYLKQARQAVEGRGPELSATAPSASPTAMP